MCIYIYIERERDIDIQTHTLYVCAYIYIYIVCVYQITLSAGGDTRPGRDHGGPGGHDEAEAAAVT